MNGAFFIFDVSRSATHVPPLQAGLPVVSHDAGSRSSLVRTIPARGVNGEARAAPPAMSEPEVGADVDAAQSHQGDQQSG